MRRTTRGTVGRTRFLQKAPLAGPFFVPDADPPALPARLSLVAAIDQGAPARRLGGRAPARSSLVVPAAAAVAQGRAAAPGRRRRRVAARTHGGDRQLARGLLCDGAGRADGLPRGAAEPRRRAR